MSVSELCNFPTNDLASHSRFIPTDINVPHYQLRNFISAAYDNKIYYVQNYDIFLFDLANKLRCLVATVPFEARCLAAGYGWVCVGGEVKGDCAFVRIAENGGLPGNVAFDLVVETLGQEIVNSMTIHCIPGKQSYKDDEIVVLISNNDRTVTLYSLTQQEVLTVLTHPKPMNYAAMSPDCTIITAVGDANEAYFYRQGIAGDGEGATSNDGQQSESDWQLIAKPAIPAAAGVRDDWSFAVAYSPDGKLCAVSAQGGLITVFDMHHLVKNLKQPEKSIICSFKSSRPSVCGCVRSMAFSPAPWDLLAWTEDHGRIGIADVRHIFTRRQCLTLAQKDSQTLNWEDKTPGGYPNLDVKERLKQQHQQRMNIHRHGAYRPEGVMSVNTQAPEVRSYMTPPTNPLAWGPYPSAGTRVTYQPSTDLNDSERSVLNALETTINDVEHHMLGPYSINYTSTPSTEPSVATPTRPTEYEVQLSSPGTRIRGTPQRRQSVILSENTSNRHLAPLETARTTMTASPIPMSEDTSTPPMSTNDLTPTSGQPTSQPLPHNIPASDPWHVIEANLATDRTRRSAPMPRSDSPTAMIQVETAIRAERQLRDRLEQQLTDEQYLSRVLRVEIDARARLIEARQQEIRAQQPGEERLSPSLEQVLHRQLQDEQVSGRRRTDELESELDTNDQRLDRLMNGREHLLHRARPAPSEATHSSARSSALPTTPTNTRDFRELESTVRRTEQERLARLHRIDDLEIQVRQAESRVELASVQSRLERVESANRHHERLLDARFLSAARGGSSAGTLRQLRSAANDNTSEASTQATGSRIRGAAARRSEAAMNADRSTIPSTPEPHGRVSDSDLRMARIMMQRAEMDANGNWVSGQGLRNIIGARRPLGNGLGGARARTSALEAMNTEEGVGTAGIGWSSDGKYLFVGTEAGIFEFKTNIRDRKCFGVVEMR